MSTQLKEALESLTELSNLIRAGGNSLSMHAELAAAADEVRTRFSAAMAVAIDSQEKTIQLQEQIVGLKQQLAEVVGWETDAARYQLTEIAKGKLAYLVKPDMMKGEPSHLLCARCFNDRKKSLLQVTWGNDMGTGYECHTCASKIDVDSGYCPPAEDPYEPSDRS